VSLGGASPLSPTIFVELKPQQTGTRLLIGYGEVATTSGSTTFLPGRLIAGHRPLKASVVVRVLCASAHKTRYVSRGVMCGMRQLRQECSAFPGPCISTAPHN